MHKLFPSLNLDRETAVLVELARESSGLACHADADGFCAGLFVSQLTTGQLPTFYVSTEDLTLTLLTQWVEQQRVSNLATFDVNVLSAAGALHRLAGKLKGQLHVYDDHIGAASEIPANVKIVELLPSADDGLPRIRPASFFCYALLQNSSEPVTPMLDLLLLAAAHGEGVAHSLKRFLPVLPTREANALARQIGRGINAYFTDLDCCGQDPTLNDQLMVLMNETLDQPFDRLIPLVRRSTFFQMLQDADSAVSQMVDEHARSALDGPPWAHAEGIPIYLVRVQAPRRIVNLVASATRTKLDRGVTIALQETPSGVGLELRRSRNLNHPDLSAALLALPAEAFVSRGGHPMAAGATIKSDTEQEVLSELARELRRQVAR